MVNTRNLIRNAVLIYLLVKKPRYALLISGKERTGKTYFVQNELQKNIEADDANRILRFKNGAVPFAFLWAGIYGKILRSCNTPRYVSLNDVDSLDSLKKT